VLERDGGITVHLVFITIMPWFIREHKEWMDQMKRKDREARMAHLVVSKPANGTGWLDTNAFFFIAGTNQCRYQ
jgi:hypothetical protein